MALLKLGAALLPALLLVQSPRVSEYQVKAVFLFNFAQFVEWPATPDSQKAVIIGILGEDPLGAFLDETVRGERLGLRPFEIVRYRELTGIESCNILFISRSENKRVAQILAILANRPVLTVSDGDDFAKRGGMIQFVSDQNRIRLRINLAAAQAANVTISSKLLRVAEIVGAPRR